MYRIVEEYEGVFKIYYKGWIFWHSFKEVIDGKPSMIESKFYSLRDAEIALSKFINNKKKNPTKFKLKIYSYMDDGTRVDIV